MLQNLIETQQAPLQRQLQQWREGLQVPERMSLRAYHSVATALTEAVRGLQNLFPSKKLVYLVGGQHPLFDPLQVFLMADAFDVRLLSWSEAMAPEASWLNEDFSFCVMVEDHFLTGELYPSLELQDRLESLRKHFISLATNVHRYHRQEYQRKLAFGLRIFQWSEYFCCSLLGTRLRKLAPLQLASSFFLQAPHLSLPDLSSTPPSIPVDHLLAEEQNIAEALALEPVIPKPTRSCDRYVLRVPGIDSFAVKEYLCEQLSLSSELVLTASLCEWGGVRPLAWIDVNFPGYELLILDREYFHDKHDELARALHYIKDCMQMD